MDIQPRIDYHRPWVASYQARILDSPARFTVCEAATKIGKTASHIIWLFEQALNKTPQNGRVWWIAPVYSQAEIAFTRMRNQVNERSFFKVNETKLRLTIPTGASIEFKTAEKPDNLYGEDVYAAVFDEFTRAREEAWTALRTTLTATKAPCKFIGNVRGKGNWGYRLGLKAKSGEPGYEYFKITAYDGVEAGILDLQEIEQAKKDLSDNAFRQLYLAEALDDQANPFGLEFIRAAIRPLSGNQTVCFGIDLAKSHDWTVVTGLDEYGQITFFERWQSDWGQTRERIARIVGNTPALVDSTGVGDPIVEDLQRVCHMVQGFNFTSTSKQKIMEGLVAGIQKGKVTVLDGVMRDEMESFEFEYSRNGVKYSAPDGLHDDCVCSLALAYSKLSSNPAISAVFKSY